MQKARLLHSSEVVDVLSVNYDTKQARICRQGFEQTVALETLVFEDQRPTGMPSLSPPAPFTPLPRETEVWLAAHPPRLTAQVEVRHGFDTPALYTLWIAQGATWHRLLYFLAFPQERQTVRLTHKEHPLPWHLALQRLLLPTYAEALPELVHLYFTVERGQLRLLAPQKLEPERTPPQLAAVKPLLAEPPTPLPLPDFSESSPPKRIDLHIEKLAPALVSSSPEIILNYQRLVLLRYLRACESRRYDSVVVIHGIGEMKLYQELQQVCKSAGWTLRKLPEPPYLNGASRVYFWSKESTGKK